MPRSPEERRALNAARMRKLRADRRQGLRAPKEKRHGRMCPGCGKQFWVERRDAGTWCSTTCSNKRFLGEEVRRFWSFVDPSGGTEACWPWTGGRDFKDGRGRFWIAGTTEYAPRLVWTFVHGEIPEKLHVLHKCDNPPCCNPQHLFLGTLSDNTQDMLRKGRGRYGPNRPHSEKT